MVVVLDAMGKNTLERYLDASDREIQVPNIRRLGLGNILDPRYNGRIEPAMGVDLAIAAEPRSVWVDSVMGHRELMGFIDPTNYELFVNGFPGDFVQELGRQTRRDVLYNRRAGGDAAIAENHAEHTLTKGLILYASMCDPIAQIAAHESVIPPDELHRIAKIAFSIAQEKGVNVTRVITRPYTVKGVDFTRTGNRRDVVLELPPGTQTLIDIARAHGVYTVSIGKPSDVVNTTWDVNRDISGELPSELDFMYTDNKHKDKNPYSIREALEVLKAARTSGRPTLVFCNLPDTDSVFGHNRIIEGNLRALEAFDQAIPLLEAVLPKNSFLFITADHGMRDGGDYGYHSREPVPVIGRGYNGPLIREAAPMSLAPSSYAIVGDVIAQIFGFREKYFEQCKLYGVFNRTGS